MIRRVLIRELEGFLCRERWVECPIVDSGDGYDVVRLPGGKLLAVQGNAESPKSLGPSGEGLGR